MNRYQKQNKRNLQKEALRPIVDESRRLYKNHTDKLLLLPKESIDGKYTIGPNETFVGNKSFMYLVENNPPMCIFVEELSPEAQPNLENIMPEQKLILDQPDTVTTAGKVEHVIVQEPTKPLNDAQSNTPAKEQLLTEDPIDGIEILND